MCAYSVAWNEAAPVGSTTDASTIDTELQNVKVSIRERLEDVVNDWTDNTVDPKTLVVLDYRGGVSLSGNIAIVTGTPTIVTWTTQDFDVGDLIDISGGPTLITIPTNGAGLYLVTANVTYDCTGATYCKAFITAGGNDVAFQTSHTNVTTIDVQLTLATIVPLVATNTITLTVQHNHGSNLNLLAAGTTLQAVKLI